MKNAIHQIERNEWLLLSEISARFTAKFEMVFAVTQETLFLRVFILKPTERA